MYEVVKFYGDSCGPCKIMAPIFDEIAETLETGNVEFTSANISNDKNREFAQSLGIRGIPTFAIIKDGKMLGSKTGAMSKDTLKEFIMDKTKEAC